MINFGGEKLENNYYLLFGQYWIKIVENIPLRLQTNGMQGYRITDKAGKILKQEIRNSSLN